MKTETDWFTNILLVLWIAAVVCWIAVVLFTATTATADDQDWAGKRVMILGDSLVGEGSGLEIGLRKRFEAMGAHVDTRAKIGGRASSWAKNEELRESLAGWRPDVAVVALGMNSCRTPPKTYGRHVRALAKHLDRVERCYWIGPPLLVEGTAGFILKMPETVESNSKCKYFSTIDKVEFQPGSVSGFHVRRWKGKRWAKSVWAWMHKESADGE